MFTPPSAQGMFLPNNKSASPSEQYINPFRSTTINASQIQQNNNDLSLFNTINPFKQQQLNSTMMMSNYNTTASAASTAGAPSFSKNPFL